MDSPQQLVTEFPEWSVLPPKMSNFGVFCNDSRLFFGLSIWAPNNYDKVYQVFNFRPDYGGKLDQIVDQFLVAGELMPTEIMDFTGMVNVLILFSLQKNTLFSSRGWSIE